MRQLILLVCVIVSLVCYSLPVSAGMIPSWEDQTGKFAFFPISNELSVYKNYDDTGEDRGETVQIIAINSLKIFTSFTFEFTADYNFDFTPGLERDHYVELSLVKPLTPFISMNYQRVLSTFEPEPVNQFGFRLVF